ncbi:MAG: Gldg family protein [Candidatus Sumerlaeota bacterium]|nr:Gldg family protein [Candidatus Sumerlaeota bacterium]
MKSLKYGAQALAMILLVAVILTMVNLLASQRGVRGQLDLTRNHLYTMPEASLRVMREVKDVVNITVYLTRNLPPRIQEAERQLRDMLALYSDESGGRLAIEYVDPATGGKESESKFIDPLRQKGIQAVQVPFQDPNHIEVVRIYMSLEVRQGDRSQVLPTLFIFGSMGQAYLVPEFEYAFAAAVKKVTQTRSYRVGLTSSMPGLKVGAAFKTIVADLKQQCDVAPDYAIQPSRPIRSDLDALILIAPRDFTPAQLFQIDQFIMNGGRVIALVDRVDPRKDIPLADVRDVNLNLLLEYYGVRVNPDLILDLSSSVLHTFPGGPDGGNMTVKVPSWIIAPIVNPEHPVVNQLHGLALGRASSIATVPSAPGGGKVTPLVLSSPTSWATTEPLDLRLNPPAPRNQDAYSSRVVAAAITGLLKSYYAARPLGDELTSGPDAIEPGAIKRETPSAQIIVVSDTDFLSDFNMGINQAFGTNRIFISNAIDWMTVGGDLISIRSRGFAPRRINPELTDAAKTQIKYLNAIAIPALVVLLGLAVLTIRRINRRRLAATYRRGQGAGVGG